jgi:uncharacterized protein (DUF1330 family)
MNAYLILDIEIHYKDSFQTYANQIPKYVKKHLWRYIVMGGEPENIEGSWNPARVVIIEFPSKQNALEFVNDSETKNIFSIRHKSASSKSILVEGCINQ